MGFDEHTYPALLGMLDSKETSVAGECVFVDPVADIAVLGPPDDQGALAIAFDELTESLDALQVADAPARGRAWLLSLDGHWIGCAVNHMGNGAPLWITDAASPIEGGMSGSPILSEGGKAIGVVVASREGSAEGAPTPRLTEHLPAWLVAACVPQRRTR